MTIASSTQRTGNTSTGKHAPTPDRVQLRLSRLSYPRANLWAVLLLTSAFLLLGLLADREPAHRFDDTAAAPAAAHLAILPTNPH